MFSISAVLLALATGVAGLFPGASAAQAQEWTDGPAVSSAAQEDRPRQSAPLSDYPMGLSVTGSESQHGWDWIRDASTVFTIRHGHTPSRSRRSTQFLVDPTGRFYLRKPARNLRWKEWQRVVTAPRDANVLFKDGNLGIGTKNPQEKLSVNGTVASKEVVVTETGWADFVFEEGYDLPTLGEVEAHIEQEGHLPGMPSAEEVEASGIRLGAMDARLLRQIEELVLHTLQQQEELKQQQAAVETLRDEVEALQAAQEEPN